MPKATQRAVVECYAHSYAKQEAGKVGVPNFYEAARAMKTKRAKAMGNTKDFQFMCVEFDALYVSLARLFGALNMPDGGSAYSRLKQRLIVAGMRVPAKCTPRDIKPLVIKELGIARSEMAGLSANLQAVDTWLRMAMIPGTQARPMCLHNAASFARSARKIVDKSVECASRCLAEVRESAPSANVARNNEQCA